MKNEIDNGECLSSADMMVGILHERLVIKHISRGFLALQITPSTIAWFFFHSNALFPVPQQVLMGVYSSTHSSKSSYHLFSGMFAILANVFRQQFS